MHKKKKKLNFQDATTWNNRGQEITRGNPFNFANKSRIDVLVNGYNAIMQCELLLIQSLPIRYRLIYKPPPFRPSRNRLFNQSCFIISSNNTTAFYDRDLYREKFTGIGTKEKWYFNNGLDLEIRLKSRWKKKKIGDARRSTYLDPKNEIKICLYITMSRINLVLYRTMVRWIFVSSNENLKWACNFMINRNFYV